MVKARGSAAAGRAASASSAAAAITFIAGERYAILDAARACFVQFGFARTSIDDIAARYPDAQAALRGRASRLFRVYEILCVETWAIIADAPMARDFYQGLP